MFPCSNISEHKVQLTSHIGLPSESTIYPPPPSPDDPNSTAPSFIEAEYDIYHGTLQLFLDTKCSSFFKISLNCAVAC